jgi:hypothetical protein
MVSDLLSEEEAKAKICPLSFGAHEVRPRDGSSDREAGPFSCFASRCAAWRWVQTIEITVTAGFTAVIDVEDRWAEELTWWWDGRYLKTEGNTYLHRMIAEKAFGEIPPGMVVDHIDGNALNMRRENLRIATRAENSANAAPRGGKSCYRGVHEGRPDRWVAQIAKQGVRFHLGTFDTEEEAAAAYDEKAKEVHGQFARLNLAAPRQCGQRGFCGMACTPMYV